MEQTVHGLFVALDDGGLAAQHRLARRRVVGELVAQHRGHLSVAGHRHKVLVLVGDVETGDDHAEAVSQTLQRVLRHAVVGDEGLRVVIQTVNVERHTLVDRGKAGVVAIGSHHRIVAHPREDVVERTEAVATVQKEVLDCLAGEGVEVRLVDILLTGGQRREDCSSAAEQPTGGEDMVFYAFGIHSSLFFNSLT